MKPDQFRILLIMQLITLFLVVILYIRQQNQVPDRAGKPGEARQLTGTVQPDPGTNFRYGNREAENELLVFSRYNCRYCRDFFADELPGLLKRDVEAGRLSIVFLDNVNPADKVGYLMARVAEATKTGGRYEAIQELFYTSPLPEDSAEVISLALKSGINSDSLLVWLDNPQVEDNISHDNQQAQEAGIPGTPTFFMNGKIRPGFTTAADLRDMMKLSAKMGTP